jgi:uncharacterized protein
MIRNVTKGIILANKAEICKSSLSKAVGLMFSKKSDKGLIFVFEKEQIVPLHMFFVFYPIDVLFLDKNRKVLEIKRNFKPFTCYTPKNKAKYLIELLDCRNTVVGDKLAF